MLDTRQYRTDQPNGDGRPDAERRRAEPEEHDPRGQASDWLKSALLRSTGTWNVLAQQVMMGMVGHSPRQGEPAGTRWTSGRAMRPSGCELVKFLADRRVPNPVVLTGDIHSNWVNDLRGRRPQAGDAGGRHRVRRHVDHQRRQRPAEIPELDACSPPTRAFGSTTASEATCAARSHPSRGRATIASSRTSSRPAARRGR